MKNYKNSDYALNKVNTEAIVYNFANEIIEVTLLDYLAENPDRTESDFRELKELSNSMYFEQDRKENAQTKKNVPIYDIDDTELCLEKSPEELFIDEINAQEETEMWQQMMTTANLAMEDLTEVQRKRYLLYAVEGMSTWQIADLEGVNQKSVHESLQAAEKKIKKFLATQANIPPQSA